MSDGHAGHGGDAPAVATLAGSATAFVSALFAQQVGSPKVGDAALVVAYGSFAVGVLGGLTQLFKIWLDAQSYSAKVTKLEADLHQSRKNNHDERQRSNGTIVRLQEDFFRSQKRVANLEGRLGITDQAHSNAINANADNIHALADQTGVTLPEREPHLDPYVHRGDNHNPGHTPTIRTGPESP
jgi:hypothetical protein